MDEKTIKNEAYETMRKALEKKNKNISANVFD